MPDKKKWIPNAILEDRTLLFRNFEGKRGRFNAEGDRNFHVRLDDDQAKAMEADGWNVKWLEPREEGDPRQAILKVAVHYGSGRPPKIVIVTGEGEDARKTELGEDEIKLLDWVRILKTDLVLRPHAWEIADKNGTRSGIKAYLKTLYAHIEHDPIEAKYYDVPDSAASATLQGDDEDTPPFEPDN